MKEKSLNAYCIIVSEWVGKMEKEINALKLKLTKLDKPSKHDKVNKDV